MSVSGITLSFLSTDHNKACKKTTNANQDIKCVKYSERASNFSSSDKNAINLDRKRKFYRFLDILSEPKAFVFVFLPFRGEIIMNFKLLCLFMLTTFWIRRIFTRRWKRVWDEVLGGFLKENERKWADVYRKCVKP